MARGGDFHLKMKQVLVGISGKHLKGTRIVLIGVAQMKSYWPVIHKRTGCMLAYKRARPGAFKRKGYFLRSRIFGEAQKLSVCHKSVKCCRN